MTTKHRVVFEVESSMLSVVLSANDHSKGVRLVECELMPNGISRRPVTRHRVSGEKSSDLLLKKMVSLNKPVAVNELTRWWAELGFSKAGLHPRMYDLERAGLVKKDKKGLWTLTEAGRVGPLSKK